MTYAYVEQRNGVWVVIAKDNYHEGGMAIIGRHTAKYKATEQADRYNDNVADDK